jgi:hypothetical protein
VTQQIARYGQMVAGSRRLKKLAKQCEAVLKDAASGVAWCDFLFLMVRPQRSPANSNFVNACDNFIGQLDKEFI